MAISIYMEVESEKGGAVKGGCDVGGREGWMECIEYAHMVYMPIDRTTGSLTGNRVHEPLQVTKTTDCATPVLYHHLCTGASLKSVKLHFYRITSKGKEIEYFTVTLENAQIIEMKPVMYNTRKDEYREMPHLESVKFGYQKITWVEKQDNIETMDDYRGEK